MSAGAGAGLEIFGSLLGGLTQRASLRAEARVHDENARLALLSGEEQVALTRRDERQISGAMIASMAQSGMALGTGTALDLIHENAIQREVEIGNLRAQAAGEARNYRQQAVDARHAAGQALIGGIFDAVGAGINYEATRRAQLRVDAQRRREWEDRTAVRPVTPGQRQSFGVVAPRHRPSWQGGY